jgi:hypothetical protein
MSKYRFKEDKIMKEVLNYIESTYSGHYVGDQAGQKKEKIQTIDIWQTLGTLDTTSRDTAIKYLMRYGRKEGFNKKDLLKAIHYIILLWYATQDGE